MIKLILALWIGFGFSFLAQAEEEVSGEESFVEEISEQEDSGEGVEKIQVIGSRVKRIDFEGPSPVKIFTKEDLERSGYFSLTDFLQNTSLSNFGYENTEIHNRKSLTLVNGRRLVYDVANKYIPISAIERLEVLKDGASALYGSDVVGGVFNIVTKKVAENEFSFKINPTFPFNPGGNKLKSHLVLARDFSRGFAIGVLQFRYAEALKTEQRKKWYHGKSRYSHISYYPSFKTADQLFIDPACPAEDRKDNIGCQTDDIFLFSRISPELFEFSHYNYMEYELSPDLTVYSQTIAAYASLKNPESPVLQTDAEGLEIPSDHKMSEMAGEEGKLVYLFKEHRWQERTWSVFLDTSIGFKGYLSKTWDYDLNFKWSNRWAHRTFEDAIVKDSLISAIKEGKYDPFDKEVRDFSSVSLHDAKSKDNDTRIISSFDLSGEAVWGVGLALGLQAYYNRYLNTPDERAEMKEIYALKALDTGVLDRSVTSAYAEAVKVFFNVFELQLAGRFDYYSDFGAVFNPKLAFRYQPFESFLLRGSVGTSYEAPELTSIYQPETDAYANINDVVACYNELKENGNFDQIKESLEGKKEEEKDKIIKEFLIERDSIAKENLSEQTTKLFEDLKKKESVTNNCKPKGIPIKAKGNPDLKPERSLSGYLGFVWQLQEDHSLTVDAWWIKLKDRFHSSINPKTFAAELRHGKDFVENFGVEYERDSNADYNPVFNAVLTTLNLNDNTLYGFDLEWESNFTNLKFGSGHLYFKDELSMVLGASIELFPGTGQINPLGRYSLPKWRNFATLGWRADKHDLSVRLKSTAGVEKAKAKSDEDRLKSRHLLDLFYSYKMNSKTTFLAGFYNFLFLVPEEDDTQSYGFRFNSRFYPLKGPNYFIEWRQKF